MSTININDYTTLFNPEAESPTGDIVEQWAIEADVLYPVIIERILKLKAYEPPTDRPDRWYPYIEELLLPDEIEFSIEAMKLHFGRMRDIPVEALEDARDRFPMDLVHDIDRMKRRAAALDCIRLFMTRMFKIQYPSCGLKILAGIPDKWRMYPKFEE